MNDDIIQFDYIQEWSEGDRKYSMEVRIEDDHSLTLEMEGKGINEYVNLDPLQAVELFTFLKRHYMAIDEETHS